PRYLVSTVLLTRTWYATVANPALTRRPRVYEIGARGMCGYGVGETRLVTRPRLSRPTLLGGLCARRRPRTRHGRRTRITPTTRPYSMTTTMTITTTTTRVVDSSSSKGGGVHGRIAETWANSHAVLFQPPMERSTVGTLGAGT